MSVQGVRHSVSRAAVIWFKVDPPSPPLGLGATESLFCGDDRIVHRSKHCSLEQARDPKHVCAWSEIGDLQADDDRLLLDDAFNPPPGPPPGLGVPDLHCSKGRLLSSNLPPLLKTNFVSRLRPPFRNHDNSAS